MCTACRIEKAPTKMTTCDACHEALCRSCQQVLSPTAFAFLKKIPEGLTLGAYCRFCFDQNVAPALTAYNETLERAKEVFVFYTTQRNSIPLIKRSREELRVTNCPDRDETLLRLAFFAAERACNAIVGVDVKAEKVRNGSYQKSIWSGIGYPAQIDADKMNRQHAMEQIYT